MWTTVVPNPSCEYGRPTNNPVFGFQPAPEKSKRGVSRLAVAPRTIGFHDPPCHLRVDWVRARTSWVVRVRSLRGGFEDRAQILRWAQSFRPVSVEADANLLKMSLDHLPPEWESLAYSFDVEYVELGLGEETSHVAVRGSSSDLAELKRADNEGRPFLLERFAPIRRPRLTARQRYLLHSALDWGYYDVPRRITLEKMAHRLGVGLNTLSVVLRNAEGSLVRNFVAFDEKPVDPAKRARSGAGAAAEA